MATGGFGDELFGPGLFGGGGFLHVVRARSIKGQVVRVVFSEEPLAVSAAGVNDSLNPSNYTFSVVKGQAGQPLSVGVDPNPIPGPAASVQAGEFGIDVHVDRPLAVGITYRATATNIQAKAGGGQGSPYSGDFVGMVLTSSIVPPVRNTDNIDIKNDPFEGRFIPTSSGDLSNQGGLASLRKRILRRLYTPTNSFSFLPGYGLGLRLKEVASIGQLQALKIDATSQVKKEPEVVSATVSLTQDSAAPEVVQINIHITTKTGLTLQVGGSFGPGISV